MYHEIWTVNGRMIALSFSESLDFNQFLNWLFKAQKADLRPPNLCGLIGSIISQDLVIS